jgi:phosphatidylserine/phosphatidylglycerophosphate/cardiolipin synthase-like enzyme
MKRLIYHKLALMLMGASALCPAQKTRLSNFGTMLADLGKTHFIIGLPAQLMPEKRVEPQTCERDYLTGILTCKDGTFKQAFFSPDDNLQELLLRLIDREQESIKLAIYAFTDGEIAQALVEAHQRGVKIEVVTDISCLRDKFNKIEYLQEKGIVVLVYNPSNKTVLNNIMHNKFVIFGKNVGGKSLVWTGSFNITKSARLNNQENIIILDEMHIIDRYSKQFALLQKRTKIKEPIKIAQRKKRYTTQVLT